jgi:hypothetical protein
MGTLVELALGGQFVVGVFFQFFYFEVAFVLFLFEVLFQQEEGFVDFAHVFLFALDACFFFLVDGFVGFCVKKVLLYIFYLVSFWP